MNTSDIFSSKSDIKSQAQYLSKGKIQFEMRFQVVLKDSCVYVINVAVLFKYFKKI